MQYIKLNDPIIIEKKIPVLLFSNFILPSDEEKIQIYEEVLKNKQIWKKENGWENYMSSYGVPKKLCYEIEPNKFFDDLYHKFIVTSKKYLNKINFYSENKTFNIRCLNSHDPHYVWNSILNENNNSIIGIYCLYSDPEHSKELCAEIDLEYRGKFLNYTLKEYDLLIFPNTIDYALRPPLSKKYQVVVSFGINITSNIKKTFCNYI